MTITARIGEDVDAFLDANAPGDVARVLSALAEASLPLVHLIRHGRLAGTLDASVGPARDDFARKPLDQFAKETFINGLKGAGVRAVVSEERDDPVAIDAAGTLLVAIDPLDGSSNIDANISIAPSFRCSTRLRANSAIPISFSPASISAPPASSSAGRTSPWCLRPARASAGRHSIRIRTLIGCRASASGSRPIPTNSPSTPPEGDEGPRGRNFNMRWVDSSVADAYRILARGGVCLYPEDSREGYEHGGLRLLCEANPLAFLVEQAGGAAIDGFDRILEIKPTSIHGRTPLIFGSKEKVERIALYYSEGTASHRAPLFGKRGLLRR